MMVLISSVGCTVEDSRFARHWWLNSRLGIWLSSRHPTRVQEEEILMMMTTLKMKRMLEDQEDLEGLED